MKRVLTLTLTLAVLSLSACSDSDDNKGAANPAPEVVRKSSLEVGTGTLKITGDLETEFVFGKSKDDDIGCYFNREKTRLSIGFRRAAKNENGKTYWPDGLSIYIPANADLNGTYKFNKETEGFSVLISTLAEGLWYENECTLELQKTKGVLDFTIECLDVDDQSLNSTRKIDYRATGSCSDENIL